jgi:hypothetical protein
VELDSANGLLDALGLESWNFSRCVEQADRADCASTRISWLTGALESAYGCAEIAGRLRDVHPNMANRIANTWRDLAAEIAVDRNRVVENRRAELVNACS